MFLPNFCQRNAVLNYCLQLRSEPSTTTNQAIFRFFFTSSKRRRAQKSVFITSNGFRKTTSQSGHFHTSLHTSSTALFQILSPFYYKIWNDIRSLYPNRWSTGSNLPIGSVDRSKASPVSMQILSTILTQTSENEDAVLLDRSLEQDEALL